MAKMTTTALSRWSSVQMPLPDIEGISEVNIFDFDNTQSQSDDLNQVFYSPLPNRNIWDGPTLGLLQSGDRLVGGGWWHYSPLLSALGQGADIEEPRAWEGWWNEGIVNLARGSIEDKSAVTIMLTGRKQQYFAELLNRMLKSKGLAFDMVVLRPEVLPDGRAKPSTKDAKQKFFEDVMMTYVNASHLTIYEDRPSQAKSFESFIEELNLLYSVVDGTSPRAPFIGTVVAVAPETSHLAPEVEIEEIMKMLNAHNVAVKDGTATLGMITYTCQKNRLYTGYLISPEGTKELLGLLKLPASVDIEQCRSLGDNIMISFRPPSAETLSRAGGLNTHRKWRVTGLGNYNYGVWAARLAPVDLDSNSGIYTDHSPPAVILAHLRGVKTSDANRITSWTDIPEGDERAIVFDSVVSDKSLLRIVPEMEVSQGMKRAYNNGGPEPTRGSWKHARVINQQGRGSYRYTSSYNPSSDYSQNSSVPAAADQSSSMLFQPYSNRNGNGTDNYQHDYPEQNDRQFTGNRRGGAYQNPSISRDPSGNNIYRREGTVDRGGLSHRGNPSKWLGDSGSNSASRSSSILYDGSAQNDNNYGSRQAEGGDERQPPTSTNYRGRGGRGRGYGGRGGRGYRGGYSGAPSSNDSSRSGGGAGSMPY